MFTIQQQKIFMNTQGHYGHPGPANDHLLERSLDDECSQTVG
jgi:hypothetical protein